MKKIYWLYALGFIVSLALIAFYFTNICYDIKVVLMSIGASLIGAVALGFFIEKINESKIKTLREMTIASSVYTAKEVIVQLNEVCDVLRKDENIQIDFTNEIDFNSKAMDQYLNLTGNHLNKEAELLQDTIFDDVINKTFIVSICEHAIITFDSIICSKNYLIINEILSNEDIYRFERASLLMQHFIKELEERKSSVLITRELQFRDSIEYISNIKLDK